jgi:hypothetical protein
MRACVCSGLVRALAWFSPGTQRLVQQAHAPIPAGTLSLSLSLSRSLALSLKAKLRLC